MRRHVLVVGGQDTSAVKTASLGVDVTLFQLPNMLSPAQTTAAKRVFAFDFENPVETVALAKAVHQIEPFDAVVSFWERALHPAALVAEALDIAGNPVHPVRVTRDKLAMRELLLGKRIDVVRFRACDDTFAVRRFLDEVGGPIILKPTMGSGSAGVSRIAAAEEVDEAWAWTKRAGLLPIIAEEFIDGPEYSVESLTLDGHHRVLAVTEKTTTDSPHYVEIAHRMPAGLPPELEQRIHAVVKGLLDAVQHRIGPAHSEVRIDAAGTPIIIETQTRFGGDQIWEMVEIVRGVDLVRATCAHLLDMPPDAPSPRAPAAAIRFFAYEDRAVHAVRGVDAARAVPGVVRVDCKLKPGDRLGPLVASKNRQGYVLATGGSIDEASATIERALAEIHIEWEDAANSAGAKS